MRGILTLGIFSTLCACARPCDLLLSLGKLAVSLDLLLFLILPGLSMHLGHTLFRWYLLVLSRGIRLDFVIACQVSSWNFVVMHGKCSERAANFIYKSFVGSVCDWSKISWKRSSAQLLLSEAVYGVRARRSQLFTCCYFLSIIALLSLNRSWRGHSCMLQSRFLGSARGVLMFNLILSHLWEAVSTPEC